MRLSRVTPLVFCAALVAAAPCALAGTQLAWKFKSGDKLTYSTVTDNKSSMSFNGMDLEFPAKVATEHTVSIDAVSDKGVAEASVTIKRIKLTMSMGPGGELDYDSASDEKPDATASTAADLIDGMVDKPVKVKIDPTGKWSDVQFPPEMKTAFENAANAGPLAGIVSEASFKEGLSQVILPLPAEPVEPGQSFEDTVQWEIPFDGNQSILRTFTYKGAEQKNGQIVHKFEAKQKTTITPGDNAPFKMTVKDEKTTFAVYFNAVDGRLTLADIKTDVEAEFDIMGNAAEMKTTGTSIVKPGTLPSTDGAEKK